MSWRLDDLPLPPGRTAGEFRIPDRLNTALSILSFAAAVGLLWLGSQRVEWWWAFGIGVVFSYVMLLVYALIHQAQHNSLHSQPAWNYWLGVLTSLLFPAPFTMIHTTHQGHHLRNRTDYEMFDLYYPTDNRLRKCAQFYSILVGLFWPVVPLGGIAAAVSPGIFRWKVFRSDLSTSYLLGDLRQEQVGAIRREMLLVVCLFVALLLGLHLRWQNLLIMYACFAVNWSTRQYVSHAFTERDILDGALNLRTNRLMSLLLLHGEWDLNHHRYPMIPWTYLPSLSPANEPRVSYAWQYWRQWLGPKLCTQAAPESQAPVRLSLWDNPAVGEIDQ